MIPDAIEGFGQEVGNSWPIVVMLGAVVTAVLWSARQAAKVMRRTVTEAVDPISDKLDRLVNASVDHDASLTVMWEAADEALYRTDETGLTVECNQAYLRMWGFGSVEQSRTHEWINELREDYEHVARQRLESIILNPRKWSFTMPLRDGRTLKVVGKPVMKGGIFRGYVGAVFDVTGTSMEIR